MQISKNIPEFMYSVDKNKKLKPYLSTNKMSTNRQSYKTYFAPNGELYISNVESFKKTKKLINRNTYGYISKNKILIDIDTINDLKIARAIFKLKNCF
jgi:CMP-N-acetylneuraminic acid synthetase